MVLRKQLQPYVTERQQHGTGNQCDGIFATLFFKLSLSYHDLLFSMLLRDDLLSYDTGTSSKDVGVEGGVETAQYF
jgi:hypothetical protein